LAIVAGDDEGSAIPGDCGFVPDDARLADDGDVAGSKPGTAAICGVFFVDGSAGAAERATADESSGGVSCFHQAQRGPDWQPDAAARKAAIVNAPTAYGFMFLPQLTRMRLSNVRYTRVRAKPGMLQRLIGICGTAC
jgi:hypothetical protein